QFCGSDYLLLPVDLAASFHPKFILLLGKRGARLILGSHNVTLAGFGINREITTSFTSTTDGPTANPARIVWRFVRAWARQFPGRIQDLISATERIAPWISHTDDLLSSPTILGSEPSGPALWERMKILLGGTRVHRITIVSPYFDAKLA